MKPIFFDPIYKTSTGLIEKFATVEKRMPLDDELLNMAGKLINVSQDERKIATNVSKVIQKIQAETKEKVQNIVKDKIEGVIKGVITDMGLNPKALNN